MARYAVFLRGINLGAKRRVPMERLRAVLTEAGYENVRTLLQSGNVVLSSDARPQELERDVAEAVQKAFGFEVPTVVRTRNELAAVISGDPFGDEADDPARYQVSFLSAEPDREVVESLEAAEVAPERVVVRDREVYAWHPDGVRNSKLAKLITADKLGVEVTARNWRTLAKVSELAEEGGG